MNNRITKSISFVFRGGSTVVLARILPLVIGVLLVGSGCGDQKAKLSSEERNAFADAPAEVQQLWQAALAAGSSNDYVTASSAFNRLNGLSLTEPQIQQLQAERDVFGRRLLKAAEEENNPAAIQALRISQRTLKTR